jgi:predicted aspartyl protease
MQLKYKNPSHFFTIKSNGIAKTLLMDNIEFVQIDAPFTRFKTKGIWDTGATGTVITQEVLDALQLKPFGRTKVSTASVSNETKETYLVNVYLKADLLIQGVEVTVGKIAAEHGINCLIGMDIITLGDFSLTNFEGKTCLSFRLPSQHSVDYVKKFQAEKEIIERHFAAKRKFNTPCICGSGKKFKNCHGRVLVEA